MDILKKRNPILPLAPEIIWFTPSDAFLHHPYDMLYAVNRASAKNGPGLVAHYQGDELQGDTGSKIWVSVWLSLEHHRNIMQHETYIDLVLPMLEAMDGSTQPAQALIPAPFSPDLARALEAPLTQFFYVTLFPPSSRPWHDRGDLAPLVEKLKCEMGRLDGCLAACWGPSVDKDALEIGVVGWRSVQDRNKALNGPLQSMLADIRQISAIRIRDAVLTCTF